MPKRRTVSLNPRLESMKDEAIIDVFTDMGAYCGSFVVPEKHLDRFTYSLRAAGHNNIKGVSIPGIENLGLFFNKRK